MYNSRLPKEYTLLDSIKGSAKTGTGVFIIFELLNMLASVCQKFIATFATIVWKLIRKYVAPRFSANKPQSSTANVTCLPAVQDTYRTSAGFNLHVALGVEQIKKQRALQKN